MVECSEVSELMFEKLLTKLVDYKKIKSSGPDQAKFEFSHFMNTLMKENKDEFLPFRKETDQLDEFFWRYVGSKDQFKSLRKLFQIVLILSHGQAQVECGFTINKQLLDDNVSSETLVVQTIVDDHMLSHNIKPYQIELNSRMMELVKNSRKTYFLQLKGKGLKKLKTSVNVQWEKLNEEIEDTNSEIKLLESTVEQLKADADKFSFAAEKKTSLVDIKATISKVNAMKRAASEKQEMLEKLQNKKKRIMEMKSEL